MRQKKYEEDIKNKKETNVFADFLRRVIITSSEQASKPSYLLLLLHLKNATRNAEWRNICYCYHFPTNIKPFEFY